MCWCCLAKRKAELHQCFNLQSDLSWSSCEPPNTISDFLQPVFAFLRWKGQDASHLPKICRQQSEAWESIGMAPNRIACAQCQRGAKALVVAVLPAKGQPRPCHQNPHHSPPRDHHGPDSQQGPASRQQRHLPKDLVARSGRRSANQCSSPACVHDRSGRSRTASSGAQLATNREDTA